MFGEICGFEEWRIFGAGVRNYLLGYRTLLVRQDRFRSVDWKHFMYLLHQLTTFSVTVPSTCCFLYFRRACDSYVRRNLKGNKKSEPYASKSISSVNSKFQFIPRHYVVDFDARGSNAPTWFNGRYGEGRKTTSKHMQRRKRKPRARAQLFNMRYTRSIRSKYWPLRKFTL